MAPSAGNGLQDFLSPKSMITPGLAAGVTVFVTNAVCSQFDCPRKYMALGLSFILGALVFVAKGIPRWQSVILYVLNSLIIFSSAIGANNAIAPTKNVATTVSWMAPRLSQFALVSSAMADDTNTGATTASKPTVEGMGRETNLTVTAGAARDLQNEISRLKAEVEQHKLESSELQKKVSEQEEEIAAVRAKTTQMPPPPISALATNGPTKSSQSTTPQSQFFKQW